MRYLLSRAGDSLLARIARDRTLCAFDFDGTLSPIAASPRLAVMRGRTRRLLARVATLYPCVIISGRSRADLLAKLRRVKVARAIGNHGAETGTTRTALADRKESRRLLRRWKAALETELAPLAGVWVEDKDLSLSVHYRQCPRKSEARRRILAIGRKLDHVRVVGGKDVVNLVARHAPDKGDALAAERDRLRCRWVLYVGDDENDEEAFALDGNIVAVRIGRKQRSHARFYLRTQEEIDILLERLIALHDTRDPAVARASAAPRKSA